VSLDVVDHEAAALARLPEYLKDKPKLAALLAAYTAQCNDLETALQELLTQRAIDTAVGDQLDDLGVIVGQERGGLADADYRRYLRARVATNKSRGTIADILKIAGLIVNSASVTRTVTNHGVAAYTLTLAGATVSDDLAAVVLAFLQDASAGGVRAIVNYSNTDPASVLVWGSTDPAQLWGAEWSGSID
jgi:hypothetical protein